MKITVQGDVELRQQLKILGEAVAHQRLRNVMYEAADMIRGEALRIYHSLRKGHGKDPGNLERHMLVEMSKKPNVASAWFKNKAKHAHLFEFGHVLWTGGRRAKGRGKMRARGEVKGHPFFRPAVDATKSEVRARVKERIVGLLNEAAKAQQSRPNE